MNRFYQFLILVGLSVMTLLANAQITSTTPVDSTSLKVYVGTYSFAGGAPVEKYTITLEDGNLYGKADSYEKSKLLKQEKDDTFKSTSSYGSIITFQRDANKAVTGFSMAIQGNELTASKDKP